MEERGITDQYLKWATYGACWIAQHTHHPKNIYERLVTFMNARKTIAICDLPLFKINSNALHIPYNTCCAPTLTYVWVLIPKTQLQALHMMFNSMWQPLYCFQIDMFAYMKLPVVRQCLHLCILNVLGEVLGIGNLYCGL